MRLTLRDDEQIYLPEMEQERLQMINFQRVNEKVAHDVGANEKAPLFREIFRTSPILTSNERITDRNGPKFSTLTRGLV